MKPVIVGLDPGTTSAYAIIDFSCKVVRINSRKDFGLSNMISEVIHEGSPLLIGTDKKEIPGTIREFSQKTGAKIITPKYDLKKGEKKAKVIRSRLLEFTRNVHEIDALASALYAFEQYRPLIKKISLFVKGEQKEELSDKIITLLIDEDGLSIKKAAELLEKKPEDLLARRAHITHVQLEKEKVLSKKEKHILLLTNQNIKLKQLIYGLESDLAAERDRKFDPGVEAKKLLHHKEQRILFLEKEVAGLRKELNAASETVRRQDGLLDRARDSYVMRRLPTLGFDEVSGSAKQKAFMEGEILFVDDISVSSGKAMDLLGDRIKAIIYVRGRNSILEKKTILIRKDEVKVEEAGPLAFAGRKELDLACSRHLDAKKANRNIITDILSDYKKEREKFT